MSSKIGRESDIMKLKSLAVLSMSAVVLLVAMILQKMKQNQQSQILIKTLIQQKMLLL